MWQRKTLLFMFGLRGAGDPTFEMAASYPGLEPIYSWVAGLFYILPMSLGGMSLNLLRPGYNRVCLLFGLVAAAGATSLGQGVFNSLNVFIILRITHGLLHSCINTLAFGTIADYFPQSHRARANSFLQSANFLGLALCSLSIII